MKRKKRQRKNKETAIEGRKKKGKEAFGNLLMGRGNFPFFSAAFSGGAKTMQTPSDSNAWCKYR